MTEDRRSIELEIEVHASPEDVWRALATGPGISSWYVPHEVEEREGGAATASFGPGPEMQIEARVAAWEPPRRIVFDKGDDDPGLAFEWLVEARDGGTCVVRLVNSGFGDGEEWDDQYEAMTEGWGLFLFNLQLHLEHFSGQVATSMLPMAMWEGPRSATWLRLTAALGIASKPNIGDSIVATAAPGLALSGTVVDVGPHKIALLLDQPAPGTAFIVVEGEGDTAGVSIWSYLYGSEGAVAAERDAGGWDQWLQDRAITSD